MLGLTAASTHLVLNLIKTPLAQQQQHAIAGPAAQTEQIGLFNRHGGKSENSFAGLLVADIPHTESSVMDGIGPEITTKHCPKSHLFIRLSVIVISTGLCTQAPFSEQALPKTNQTYPKLLLGSSSTGGSLSGNLLTALLAAPPAPTLYFRSLWSAFQLSSIQTPPVFPLRLCAPQAKRCFIYLTPVIPIL